MDNSLHRLEQENSHLKKQLGLLLQTARENDQKQKKFEQFEFKLMSAESIEAVLLYLENDFPKMFNYDVSTLLLANRQFSLNHLLPKTLFEQGEDKFLQLLNFPAELERLNRLPDTIYTGCFSSTHHHWLLPHHGIKSIAVLPLFHQGQKIGIFCCGTQHKNRFEAGQANDFFKRLAFIIRICIENALNREKLKLTGLTDPLTRIRNRRFFEQRLTDEMHWQERTQKPLSCILFDIDHFKKINDVYGHAAGDDVLIEVARRVQKVLRSHEILARYGGEEFAVLISNTTNEAAKYVAQRIISAVNRNYFTVNAETRVNITVSAGIATLSADQYYDKAEMGKKLLLSADEALYMAKAQGRNREINAGILSIEETSF